jgi:hypothetical protein
VKILLDLFPCHLAAIAAGKLDDVSELKSYQPTPGSTYLEITRVIVTENTVIVAKDSDSGPQIVFQEKYETFEAAEDKKMDSRVVTKSGKMLAFKKDTGCGCGSRLRGWNPYNTVNSIRD